MSHAYAANLISAIIFKTALKIKAGSVKSVFNADKHCNYLFVMIRG